MAARFVKDQISDPSDIRMCIGRRDRNARNPETFKIVDIVSKVGNLLQWQSARSRESAQDLCLVANTLLNRKPEFSAPCGHDEICFR
jgi:hypothetical protein